MAEGSDTWMPSLAQGKFIYPHDRAEIEAKARKLRAETAHRIVLAAMTALRARLARGMARQRRPLRIRTA